MKRIVLGHIAALVADSKYAEESPVKERKDEFNLKKLHYSIPKEPETWQGKGNRRKPRVK